MSRNAPEASRGPQDARGGAGSVLDDLCREAGVQRRYEAAGELHEAPEESVLHALRTLDVPIHDPADAAGALRALRVQRWQRVVEPVTVSRTPGRPGLPVRVMGSEVRDPLHVHLVREDGSEEEWTVPPEEVEPEDEVELDGRPWRTGRIRLPADLPLGYHDLTVRVGSREDRTRLIRAPATAWEPGMEGVPGGPGAPEGRRLPRQWGVFLPLYALRSESAFGTADLGDLRRLAEWTAARGGSVVGTLPLYAQFLGPDRFEPSPYAPVSRLFWNELYLDLRSAPGLEDAPEARRLLEAGAARPEAARLRGLRRSDYEAAVALRRPVVEALARAVAGGDATAGAHGFSGALEQYAAARPEALLYARFRAFGEADGRPWRDWPAAARAGDLSADDVDPERVVYHLYAQWALDRQMEALGDASRAAQYQDLPHGTQPHRYDVWRVREMLASGASGGAPPDAFFQGGQDWGFPPIHPRRSREEGHAYLLLCLRRIMEVGGIVRLDHVMGLHRLFWVPAGGSAKDGVYVRYPADELYALLCLESHRNRCEVVGEDLGTVPPEVGSAMERHRLRRMWVLPFELGADGMREPPPRSVASLGTHDLPPFAAWWQGRDVEARARRDQLEPEAVPEEREARASWRRDVVRVLAERGLLHGMEKDGGDPKAGEVLTPALALMGGTAARLVLVNLEDLWLEEESQNEPGTTGPGNWTRRSRLTLEAMDEDPGVRHALEALRRAREDDPTSDEDS